MYFLFVKVRPWLLNQCFLSVRSYSVLTTFILTNCAVFFPESCPAQSTVWTKMKWMGSCPASWIYNAVKYKEQIIPLVDSSINLGMTELKGSLNILSLTLVTSSSWPVEDVYMESDGECWNDLVRVLRVSNLLSVSTQSGLEWLDLSLRKCILTNSGRICPEKKLLWNIWSSKLFSARADPLPIGRIYDITYFVGRSNGKLANFSPS